MPNVICLGELLIDFCAGEQDVSLAEARTFVKAPGGAPANVAVGVVRLGLTAGFVGAVGQDPFGEFLQAVVAAAGVDTSHLVKVAGVRTSLAFVASRSDGRKDITFYRNPGADMCLAVEHIESAYVASAEALHFGSISRIDESPRGATDEARRLAAAHGAMVTYDLNWRPTLWPDAAAARRRIFEGFPGTTVAKVSSEEWEFVFGTPDFQAGAARLLDAGVQLVIRSEGEHGASLASPAAAGHVEAFAVDVVDTLGAGDAFMACLIVELLAHWRAGVGPGQLDQAELTRIVRRANAVGALSATRVGAIPSLPTTAEVDAFLATLERG
jgi:fructokinase